MATINVFSEGVRFPYRSLKKKEISSLARRIIRELGRSGVSCTIVATNDEYIRGINQKFRKRNSPTDVISFSQRDGAFPGENEGNGFLGEIYISLERAEEQSRRYGVSLRREVLRLMIHGMLHCLGYDHEGSETERVAMEKIEEELMEKFALT